MQIQDIGTKLYTDSLYSQNFFLPTLNNHSSNSLTKLYDTFAKNEFKKEGITSAIELQLYIRNPIEQVTNLLKVYENFSEVSGLVNNAAKTVHRIVGSRENPKIKEILNTLIKEYDSDEEIFKLKRELQNIWHVQRTNTQINGNIIDNIKLKTQGIQKGYIPTHTHRRNHEATFKPR